MRFFVFADYAKGYTFHSWRHTFRTRLTRQAASMESADRSAQSTQPDLSPAIKRNPSIKLNLIPNAAGFVCSIEIRLKPV